MAFVSSVSPLTPFLECNETKNGCACVRRRRIALGVRAGLDVPEVSRRSMLLAVGGTAYDMWASRYNLLDGSSSFLPETLGLTSARRELLSCARGDILEVAVGTGINLPFYAPENVRSLTAIDSSNAMLSIAASNAKATGASLTQGDVANLPFEGAQFDTIVDTFSMCTFADSEAALGEFRRVLRPKSTSRLLLLEHTASPNPLLRIYQDLTAPTVAAFSKGCFWNQRVESLVAHAGFGVLKSKVLLAGTVVSLELAPILS